MSVGGGYNLGSRRMDGGMGGWMDVNFVQTLTGMESELEHEEICALEGLTQEGGKVGRWWMLRVASQAVTVVGMRAYDWKDSARNGRSG